MMETLAKPIQKLKDSIWKLPGELRKILLGQAHFLLIILFFLAIFSAFLVFFRYGGRLRSPDEEAISFRVEDLNESLLDEVSALVNAKINAKTQPDLGVLKDLFSKLPR